MICTILDLQFNAARDCFILASLLQLEPIVQNLFGTHELCVSKLENDLALNRSYRKFLKISSGTINLSERTRWRSQMATLIPPHFSRPTSLFTSKSVQLNEEGTGPRESSLRCRTL